MAPKVTPAVPYSIHEMGQRPPTTGSWIGLASLIFPTGNLSNPTTYTSFDDTYTLAANRLTKGCVLRVTAWGSATNGTGTTFSMRIRIGSEIIMGATTVGNVTSATWRAWGILVPYVIESLSGSFYRSTGQLFINGEAPAEPALSTQTGLFHTNVANVIDIQARFGTSVPGSNIALEGFFIELMAPETVIVGA